MPVAAPEFVYVCTDKDLRDLANGRKQDEVALLRGLRLGVKDLFHIKGLHTSAGNPDWLSSHEVAEETAEVVGQLLEQGAQLVGKTLTDELAYSLNGINQHYGSPLNSAAPERLPGGSSSGSAVAVANNSIDIGLGTDTGGSIRVPASYNGVYGIRPTHDRVSLQGCVPLAPSFDTAGWLARDLPTLTTTAKAILPKNYRKQFTHVCLVLPEGVTAWSSWAEKLAVALAKKFDSVNLLPLSSQFMAEASETFRMLQGREIWQQHGNWITTHKPSFAEDIQKRLNWCASLTAEQEQTAKATAEKLISEWNTLYFNQSNTLLIMPSTPGAAPLLNSSVDELASYRNLLMGMTAPAGLLGCPQISMPYLTDQGAPWGLSLLAPAGSDWSMLAAAEDLSPLFKEVLTK